MSVNVRPVNGLLSGGDAGGRGVSSSKTARSERSAGVRTIRLAHVIADFVARQRWPRGRHVRELELADELRVSRTPVRAALRLLAHHGVMEARPNRGFFLTRDGSQLAKLRLETPTTAGDKLYARLLRDRVTRRVPEAMTASDVATRYAANRAVVERVLARLQDEGLLSRGAGREWRFAQSLADMQGVRAGYEFRLLIEPAAMLLPDFRILPEEVAEQQRRHRDLMARAEARPGRLRRKQAPPATVFDLDAGFHETLARFSGNPFVLRAVQQQNQLRRLLEFESYRDMHRVLEWCREHIAILASLANGDVASASRLLSAHLQRATRLAVNSIAK
jgi:DNA-binding GntR family transcriptional regulator